MSFEDSNSKENPVRFVDAFVENIDLKMMYFELKALKTEGRPKIFLNIYLYGYLNGLRSSRKLENVLETPKCSGFCVE